MNWPLFWALLLSFGFVIGNILLVKHSAKINMTSLPQHKLTEPKPNRSDDDVTR